jgi:preprotein translocase subunit SecG
MIACVVVLLQAGKGGGLAAGFGGSGTGFELLGGRQTATFLHQSTRWLGGAFLVIAFLIALLTARQNRPGSLMERELEGQPAPLEQEAGTPEDLESVVGQTPATEGQTPGAQQQQGDATQPGPAGTPAPPPAAAGAGGAGTEPSQGAAPAAGGGPANQADEEAAPAPARANPPGSTP